MSWRQMVRMPLGAHHSRTEQRLVRFLWPASCVAVVVGLLTAIPLALLPWGWLHSLGTFSFSVFLLELLLLRRDHLRAAATLYAVGLFVIVSIGMLNTGGATSPLIVLLYMNLIGVALVGVRWALNLTTLTGALLVVACLPVTRPVEGIPTAVVVVLLLSVYGTSGLLLSIAVNRFAAEAARGERQREELIRRMGYEEVLQATSALVLRHQQMGALLREACDVLAQGLRADAVVAYFPALDEPLATGGPQHARLEPAREALTSMLSASGEPSDAGRTADLSASAALLRLGFSTASRHAVTSGSAEVGALLLLFERANGLDADGRAVVRGTARLLGLATERALAERRRRELAEQLRHSQKLDALGRLSAGVAHDFNNLMTVVMTGASLALDSADDDEMKEDLSDVLQATESATTLTRQLLAFGRQQATAPEHVSVNQRLSDVGRMLHRLLGDDVEFDLKLGADLGKVLIDPGLFEQVIVNLAVNARDAMSGGGRFQLRTLNTRIGGELAASLHVAPGRFVLIEATDTGQGMSDEVLEQVFEPFFTTKARDEGTGLGLSIAHGIVRQFGGALRVESTLGEGTRFDILLPVAKEEHTAKTALALLSAPSDEGGPRRVVLVDDDALLRSVLARALRRRGYAVSEAADAASALDALASGAWDALITDVRMPGTSGTALAADVRERFPGLPVLFISGDEPVETGQGQAFLSKPFTPEVLDTALQELAAA